PLAQLTRRGDRKRPTSPERRNAMAKKKDGSAGRTAKKAPGDLRPRKNPTGGGGGVPGSPALQGAGVPGSPALQAGGVPGLQGGGVPGLQGGGVPGAHPG